MTHYNPWDKTLPLFEDNTAHPIFLDAKTHAYPKIKEELIEITKNTDEKLKLLDFGCGTGEFLSSLLDLNLDLTGLDYSKEMIEKAKLKLPQKVNLLLGDTTNTQNDIQFNIITVISVLEYIKDIQNLIHNFSKSLKPQGILLLAIYTEEYISKEQEKTPTYFTKNNEQTHLNLSNPLGNNDIQIPMYIREKSEYELVLENSNFEKIKETLVPEGEEKSKFLIQGWRLKA